MQAFVTPEMVYAHEQAVPAFAWCDADTRSRSIVHLVRDVAGRASAECGSPAGELGWVPWFGPLPRRQCCPTCEWLANYPYAA